MANMDILFVTLDVHPSTVHTLKGVDFSETAFLSLLPALVV